MADFGKRVLARAAIAVALATLSSLLVVTGASRPAGAVPTHVQAASAEITSGTANSKAFTNANTGGNLIVAFVIWNNAGTVSVSDTRGNAYTAATSRVAWGPGWSAQTFYARNVNAGTNTVTATFGTTISGWGVLYLHEYSGLDRTAPLDVTASAAGSAAAMSSGAATTTNANDLIFGAAASSDTVTAQGTGFTTRSTAFSNRIEDRTVTTAGSYSATAQQNGSSWVMHMLAFKAAVTTPDSTPPTQPTGLTATPVSGTQINLAWTASTDNIGVTGYRVFRNGTQIATPTSPAFSDTGLSPGTNYSYSVTAVDAAGNLSVPSATVSATTTSAPDTTAPTVPTGLTASVVSGAQINLSWTASTDNVGVTGYRVFRNGSQLATPSTTTYNDTGLAPGTSYTYTVSAVDAAGNASAASAPVSATTASTPDTSAPTVAVTAPTGGQTVTDIVTVTATASDNVGVVGVVFFVDSTAVGVEDTTAPFTYVWDTRSAPNGAHTLSARARDAAGNATTSITVGVNVANTSAFQNEILATGLNLPTSMVFLPDGRMLVTELPGTIKVLSPPYTSVSPTPFLQLTNVGNDGYAGLQQGIFSVTLDPNFATNHFYYIFYTVRSPNKDRLSRFTANAALNGTNLSTEVVLYQDPQVANTEHHGGAVMFGNDGKIYFTTGEHFTASDAQSLNNPRGKVHRINPDGTIPTDNPFYDGAGPHVDSIWAYGLRNPYRAYYDTPTGRMFIGDVGGNDASTAKEEINLGQAGANYGWPNSEGLCSGSCTSPIHWWAHNGRDSAVTAGFVYHGTQYPSSYQGSFFFADYAQNWIKRLTFDASGKVNGVFNFEPADGSTDGPYGDIVYLTEGPDGALYYLDLGYSDTSGTFGVSKIRRIRYLSNNLAPTAVMSGTPTNGPAPLSVTFSSAGSVDPEGQPLTYSWTFGDGTTSTAANPTHTYPTAGPYTVRLSVSDGVNTTVSTPLTISVGTLPTATILAPTDGSTFVAGDVINFSGDANDSVDGSLPASAYTWTIDFLHDGHVHPGPSQSGVKGGTFAIPTSGHDFSGNTRYRISLTVVNSAGLAATTTVTIWPVKVNLSFATAPAGLTVYLDGIAKTTPFVYDTVPGFVHTIDARDQASGSTTYQFASWSDGGSQLHSLVVPATAASYTATYTPVVVTTPPAFVQVNSVAPQTNQTAVTVKYLSAQKAGDTNVVAIGWNAATGSVVSVADSAGNAYQVAAPLTTGSGLSQTIWYAKNIAASAANANTVTVTFGGATPFVDVRIAEYTGLDPVNPLDVNASASGSSATASSGSVTTTAASELLVGAGMTQSLFTGATGGATTRVVTSPDGDILQDRVVSAGGSYSATASLGAAPWVMQMVTFRGANNGPDTTAPSQPVGLTAVAVSGSQINLSWTASTDNVGVTGYRVSRGGVQVGTPTATTFSDTGLAAGTAYSYTVVAVDAAGNVSPPSAAASATTTAPDTTAPSQPVGLTAVAVSGSQINLSWTASTDNVGVTGYRVSRGGVQVGTPTATTFSDTGLAAGTAYSYTVVAVDAAGNVSPPSAAASATTTAPDTTAPSQPVGLTAVAVSGSQINLSWTASTDNVGVTGYRVSRGGVQVGTPTATTFSDTGLAAGTAYSYTVVAVDAAGNVSPPSAAASATTTAVTATPAFVQVNSVVPQTNQSVVTVKYLSAQTAGNANIVAIGWNSATGSVVSVADSAGNAYQQAAPLATGTGLSQTVWYAKNIVASAANANTLTVTFSGALPFIDVRALEYGGLDKVNPVDATASASGSTAAASSGPVTTTFGTDLIFGAGMTQNAFTGASGGATTRVITTPDADIAQDRVVSATGTYTATATQGSAGAWVMQVVAFRAG